MKTMLVRMQISSTLYDLKHKMCLLDNCLIEKSKSIQRYTFKSETAELIFRVLNYIKYSILLLRTLIKSI